MGAESGCRARRRRRLFEPRQVRCEGRLAVSAALRLKGWTAGVNGHFNITPQWYASARAGLFRADAKGLGHAGQSAIRRHSSTEWYSGLGVGYDFNRNLSVGLNYDYYKVSNKGLNLDPGVVSASAEYRF